MSTDDHTCHNLHAYKKRNTLNACSYGKNAEHQVPRALLQPARLPRAQRAQRLQRQGHAEHQVPTYAVACTLHAQKKPTYTQIDANLHNYCTRSGASQTSPLTSTSIDNGNKQNYCLHPMFNSHTITCPAEASSMDPCSV